jgi:hypothetical protein
MAIGGSILDWRLADTRPAGDVHCQNRQSPIQSSISIANRQSNQQSAIVNPQSAITNRQYNLQPSIANQQ